MPGRWNFCLCSRHSVGSGQGDGVSGAQRFPYRLGDPHGPDAVGEGDAWRRPVRTGADEVAELGGVRALVRVGRRGRVVVQIARLAGDVDAAGEPRSLRPPGPVDLADDAARVRELNSCVLATVVVRLACSDLADVAGQPQRLVVVVDEEVGDEAPAGCVMEPGLPGRGAAA